MAEHAGRTRLRPPLGLLRQHRRGAGDGLVEIKESGARGLILDVRNNPGGLLSTTVNIASHFLDGGLVVYELDGAGERTDWNAKDGGVATELPLVLLVNQFTASAGEVLAGALQDRERAP